MAAMDPIHVDLQGQVVVVTGSNTGIGKEVARGLARLGARVIMGCRNLERAEAARGEIITSTGNEAVDVIRLDQGDPVAVREFAREVQRRHGQLDALVNNAGAWLTQRSVDAAGIESTFAVNSLGYFRLTNALQPLLLAGAPSRVVNVASKMAFGLDVEDLGFSRRRYTGADAYARSKQANRMLAWVRADRLRNAGVTVNAIHPGVVSTEIARNATGVIGAVSRLCFKVFGRTPAQGADTALWLAASPEVEGITGRFWLDRQAQRRKFSDMSANRALWDRCEELTRKDPK
jgi:NAD(P)-dependent dehydrogenase (short-subunit alcohol dehydrogenase family)